VIFSRFTEGRSRASFTLAAAIADAIISVTPALSSHGCRFRPSSSKFRPRSAGDFTTIIKSPIPAGETVHGGACAGPALGVIRIKTVAPAELGAIVGAVADALHPLPGIVVNYLMASIFFLDAFKYAKSV
jgi:hypothetical protein